jgi:FMN-dependent NADH-azoreductase|tara:strand:+ start:225 stop:488 length:264 start_codon:yes stop_codon:yes gene_type:complete
MASQEDILKAHEAETILNSDVLKEAFAHLKDEYITRWLQSNSPDEQQLREAFHKSALLLPEIEKHLRIFIEKGKLTKANIDRIRKIA